MKVYVVSWETTGAGGGGFDWYCEPDPANRDFDLIAAALDNTHVYRFDLEVRATDTGEITKEVEEFLMDLDFHPEPNIRHVWTGRTKCSSCTA